MSAFARRWVPWAWRLPPNRITVDLAPADVLKEGGHFDLPIAIRRPIASYLMRSRPHIAEALSYRRVALGR